MMLLVVLRLPMALDDTELLNAAREASEIFLSLLIP